MIYFSDAPVALESFDHQEYGKLCKFKDELYEAGLIETFSNAEQFQSKFRQQLAIQINNHPYLQGVLNTAANDDTVTTSSAEMSAEACQLLLAAASDASGHLMSISTLGGRYIQTNGMTFGEQGVARSTALWEAALNELIALTYLTPRGIKGEVFQVTNAGYTRADELKGQTDEKS